MDTGLALRSFRNTSRYYNSNVVKEVIAKEKAGCTFEDVREAVSGVMAKKMFYEKFGVAPSAEFSALYKQVVRTLHQTEMNLNAIRDTLNESEHETGAFYCEFEVFKEIYQLDVRNSARTGQSVFLGLITVTDGNGEKPEQRVLNNAMGKLLLTVNESLRRGDVYTRYSVSQYIIMLHTLTMENAEMVIERIIKRFYREYPKLAIKLEYATIPIETVI